MFASSPAEASTAPKEDSPPTHAHLDTDVESTGSEVSKTSEPASKSSDGVLVESQPEGEVAPDTNFKLTVPEPLEKASQVAIIAIQDWWAQLEPLLQKLQAQVLEQLDPYVKASAAAFARLQSQLAPHTEQAAALIAQWREQLEPHAHTAYLQVQTATQAVRVKAYEPALAAIVAASAAVQAHAQAAAALVSSKAAVGMEVTKEWLAAQQPLIDQARAAAMQHGAMALAALLEWKRQIEPLMLEQLQRARERALTLTVQASAHMVDLRARTQQQMVLLGTQINLHVQQAKVAAAPHATAAKAWVDERTAEARVHLEPALRPLVTWGEETGRQLQPALAPVNKAVSEWAAAVRAQLAVLAKQLEGPSKAFEQWLAQTMQCLCLPVQQRLDYNAASKSQDYPPPVYAAAKESSAYPDAAVVD